MLSVRHGKENNGKTYICFSEQEFNQIKEVLEKEKSNQTIRGYDYFLSKDLDQPGGVKSKTMSEALSNMSQEIYEAAKNVDGLDEAYAFIGPY